MTLEKLDQKALDLCTLAIESAADNDESIDKRDASKLEFKRGAEVTGVAWLSGYDSRGDAPPMIQKVIDSLYDAQAAEWQRQYPDRPGLFEANDSEDPETQRDAEAWLDATLDGADGRGDAVYLQIEVIFDDDSVKWTARFTDEISAPLSKGGEGEIEVPVFLAMDDDALEALADEIAESAYETRGEDVIDWAGDPYHGRLCQYSTDGQGVRRWRWEKGFAEVRLYERPGEPEGERFGLREIAADGSERQPDGPTWGALGYAAALRDALTRLGVIRTD